VMQTAPQRAMPKVAWWGSLMGLLKGLRLAQPSVLRWVNSLATHWAHPWASQLALPSGWPKAPLWAMRLGLPLEMRSEMLLDF
jgi:hypothetical protein